MIDASVPRGWFASGRGPTVGDGPIMAVDVEVGTPIADLSLGRHSNGKPFAGVQVLVRLHGYPIGIVFVPASDVDSWSGGIDRRLLARRIWVELGDALIAHLRHDRLEVPADLTPAGLLHDGMAPCS